MSLRSSLAPVHPEQNQLKTPETFLELNDAKQTKANLQIKRPNVIPKCLCASPLNRGAACRKKNRAPGIRRQVAKIYREGPFSGNRHPKVSKLKGDPQNA